MGPVSSSGTVFAFSFGFLGFFVCLFDVLFCFVFFNARAKKNLCTWGKQQQLSFFN